ncbi:MAG: energy-coupled thiamine transporter ThiT [Coriobacteriia bacterium]|nr:energy-coupled thiamine transporter ThiT [Coriobacteriia bacterium]
MAGMRTRMFVEAALTLALAAVLNRLPVFQMPFGGSASLDMLPLVVFAVRNGLLPGLTAGAAFGFIDYMMEPYFVHWIQVGLDYPVAFGLVGLAGFGAWAWREGRGARRPATTLAWVLAAALLGILGRFGAHFVSGVVFFAEYAPEGQPVWLYSLLYNASYIVPSAVAVLAAAALILPAVERVVPTSPGGPGAR